jgi:hypothetical protein
LSEADVELGPELLSDAAAVVRRIRRPEEPSLEKRDTRASIRQLDGAGQANAPAA